MEQIVRFRSFRGTFSEQAAPSLRCFKQKRYVNIAGARESSVPRFLEISLSYHASNSVAACQALTSKNPRRTAYYWLLVVTQWHLVSELVRVQFHFLVFKRFPIADETERK